MKNVMSMADFSKEDIERILFLAKDIETNPDIFSEALKGKTLAIAFFEPSTRTRIGFSTAMQKLGGNVVEVYESKLSDKMSAPESDEDTLRVVSDYADFVALRHKSRDLVKNLRINSKIINCGNGNDEHPTQTLIDLYTILKEIGRLDNFSIAIAGDLKNMRAGHSLVLGLSKFDNIRLTLLSPKLLSMPTEYLNSEVIEKNNFEFADEDVLYVAGFPPAKEVSDAERESYILHASVLQNKKTIIMNPLPRVDEIDVAIDSMPNARYFEQSKNGLFVRMAILLHLHQSPS